MIWVATLTYLALLAALGGRLCARSDDGLAVAAALALAFEAAAIALL